MNVRSQWPYGAAADAQSGPGVAPALTRSTTFAYEDAEQLRAVARGEASGEFYTRYGHPNARAVETSIARLEGADGAVTFASGMATLFAVFAGLCRAGEAVAVSRSVYGGVDELLAKDLPRLGIEVRRFDPFQADEVEAALVAPSPRLVHVETPTNPLTRVIDVSALAPRVHEAGAWLSVDATFLPPPLQCALARGADLAVHSATKILGGHSDLLAGVVAGAHELMSPIEGFRRRTGAVLGPDAAWLLSRSLSTLALRAEQACASAAQLAAFLEHTRERGGPVARVYYPGLTGHPDHEVMEGSQRKAGFMLAFEIAGGLNAAIAVYDRLRVIQRAVSLGGVESLAVLPLHTSHATATPEERAAAGIPDGLIRLSVGIEPAEDLERDLAQALAV